MCAQNFKFAPTFPEHGGFQPKFCIFGRKFSDKKTIFRHPHFFLGGGAAISPLPPYHDATVRVGPFFLFRRVR